MGLQTDAGSQVRFRFRRREQTFELMEFVAARSGEARALGRAAPGPKIDAAIMEAVEEPPTWVRQDAETTRQWEAFETAGWRFVLPRAERVTAAARAAGGVEGNLIRQVLRDPSGNVFLDSGLVAVRVPEDMPPQRAQQRLEEYGLRIVRRLPVGSGVFEARLPAGVSTLEAVQSLQTKGDLAFAEPSFLQWLGGRLRPADPLYPNQWQFSNDGSSGGTAGADVSAEAAWALSTGRMPDGQPARIAVIDNGMDVAHPDLAAGLSAGGYFTDSGAGSARFVPRATGAFFPDSSHGTFCMGMAAARMNNGQGGCGMAPDAALIPIACIEDQVGTQTTLAQALVYAVLPTEVHSSATEPGADVVVSSLGPNGADWTMTSVLDLAIDRAVREGRGGRGTPVVWAVSNGPHDIARDEVSSDPRIIGVGRSNHLDIEDGSASGQELDLLAPGVDVLSTTSGGGYGFNTGTSFAAPLVAGVAALVLCRFPNLDANGVRGRLISTSDKVGAVGYSSGHHPQYGYGRVNAARALT